MRSAILLGSMVIVVVACSSSSESEGKPRQCLAAPAAGDLTQPVVSFKTTIVPIVQNACAFSACHGDPNTSLGIFLPKDAAQIYKSLKAPSPSNIKLDFVKPNAPDDSFVMRKLDGTQCALDKDCVNGSCGNAMPPEGVLSAEERNAFRRWISQGAQDN